MSKTEDVHDRLHARAEPDDEYYYDDHRPEPLDPYEIDRDQYDIDDEDEDEQDEHVA